MENLRLAGLIKDTNSKLTLGQIKKILIETVDKKTFLTTLVRSEGIVSEERSLRAAKLSHTQNLDSATFLGLISSTSTQASINAFHES